MTSRERAEKVYAATLERFNIDRDYDDEEDEHIAWIAAAIDEAVAEEREACAKECDDEIERSHLTVAALSLAENLAYAIRARRKP